MGNVLERNILMADFYTVEVINVKERQGQNNWVVVANGVEQSQHRLKQSAEKEARQKAKELRPSELVIRRKDNEISYTQRYEQP